jgi:hypothetical protein
VPNLTIGMPDLVEWSNCLLKTNHLENKKPNSPTARFDLGPVSANAREVRPFLNPDGHNSFASRPSVTTT